MILECLRHWVIHYRVDGFRFDLASILGRNEDGTPLLQPPLLRNLAEDPVLKDVNLIAEAWDAGGLYQGRKFPGVEPVGGVERQIPGRAAQLFKRRVLVRCTGSKADYRLSGSVRRAVSGLQFVNQFF